MQKMVMLSVLKVTRHARRRKINPAIRSSVFRGRHSQRLEMAGRTRGKGLLLPRFQAPKPREGDVWPDAPTCDGPREQEAWEEGEQKPHHLPQHSTKYCVNSKSNFCSFFFPWSLSVLLFLRVNCTNPAQPSTSTFLPRPTPCHFFCCLPCRQAHTGSKPPQSSSSLSQTFAAGQLISCRTGNATSEGNFN